MFNFWSPWTCLWSQCGQIQAVVLVHLAKKKRQRKMLGFLCTYPIRHILGLRALWKENSWYILWEIWKRHSNKYIILYGWCVIESKNVNWRINQSEETLYSLVLISLFSVSIEFSSAVPARGIFTSALLKISDLTGSREFRTAGCKVVHCSLCLKQ